MPTHDTGTREQWLKARLELRKVEKELTHRSDEVTRQRRELPWVPINKGYRFETEEGICALADLFRDRSQLLVYHFMFGPDFAAGCPTCSSIADGFNGIAVHLANHDVMVWAVSRAPLAKLQAYKCRMGWTFPWASSVGGDFNFDFCASNTEEQPRNGIDYNFTPRTGADEATGSGRWWPDCGDKFAAMCGTDASTYQRERPGMSAFVLENGIIYYTYSTYARGVDGLLGMYQWLDQAPKGRNETGVGSATTSTTSEERRYGRRGTLMFLIAPEPTTKQRCERQTRAVISQRRFRRRKSGMNTTQESKIASSIFIGRVAPPARKRVAAHADQDSPQSRIRGFSRQAHDGIEDHCCRVFVDPTGKDNPRSPRRHAPPGKRYRKDVSADVRLREGKTG